MRPAWVYWSYTPSWIGWCPIGYYQHATGPIADKMVHGADGGGSRIPYFRRASRHLEGRPAGLELRPRKPDRQAPRPVADIARGERLSSPARRDGDRLHGAPPDRDRAPPPLRRPCATPSGRSPKVARHGSALPVSEGLTAILGATEPHAGRRAGASAVHPSPSARGDSDAAIVRFGSLAAPSRRRVQPPEDDLPRRRPPRDLAGEDDWRTATLEGPRHPGRGQRCTPPSTRCSTTAGAPRPRPRRATSAASGRADGSN